MLCDFSFFLVKHHWMLYVNAGKTETAKIILRYLCWRSSHKKSHKLASHSTIIDQRLMHSSTVLESFGNAKTSRNNNSSRFGKVLIIEYENDENDPGHYHIASGNIETYLLDKNRLVHFPDEDRNFHVFYELLAGANQNLRKKYHLKYSDNYALLNNDDESEVDGKNDQTDFQKLREAMSAIGITNADQDCIFRTISAILSLGNVEFKEATTLTEDELKQREQDNFEIFGSDAVPIRPKNHSEAAAQIAQAYVVEHVAELLGISKDGLLKLLLEHFIDASTLKSSGKFDNVESGNFYSPRNVSQALFARDSIIKSLYQRVFNWIIRRIRESIFVYKDDESLIRHHIGMLDFFGFEDFQSNSLEQLLINYADESLHALYVKNVLAFEHELFVEEGVAERNVEMKLK